MINIIFPVYNEEKRLKKGVMDTITFMDELGNDSYQITIADNNSTDDTKSIAECLELNFPQVYYIRINRKGVGVAFREAVKENKADIVGYMDIDLSTDIRHLSEVIKLFEIQLDLDMINASRLNKMSNTIGRKWYRNLTSYGLSFFLKIFLGMKATDSICGFKFFKALSVEQLIREAGEDEDGWFYIIELLLRAERHGMKIYELPARWKDDTENSHVNVAEQIYNYMCSIFKLRAKFNAEGIL